MFYCGESSGTSMIMFSVTDCGFILTGWDIGLFLHLAAPQERLYTSTKVVSFYLKTMRNSVAFTFVMSMCTVNPQFDILVFCVFPDFTHFLYSPGHIPTWTLFSRLYSILWWSLRKCNIKILLYLETYIYDITVGIFVIFLPFIPLS